MTLTFSQEDHCYELDGKELQSVSKWIDQFVPEFQVDFVAGLVAKKRGVEKEFVLDMWEFKGKIALSQGNFVHDSIHYYLKYDPDFENEPVKEFKKHQSKNKYLSEVVVHDNTNAGTIDLIEVVGRKKVILHDFKTNADLYKKHGKLLAPYNDLDNTPINKYRLQLSKYKEMLEKMKGVEVVELNLWHWANNKFTIIKLEELTV